MLEERSYFGRPDSFLTLRHLTIHGSNFEIGRHLGRLARERYGCTPRNFLGDPIFARARRNFLRHSYPLQSERLRGLAAALEIDFDDDRYDLAGITYNMDVPQPPGGCSAVYYPPSTTATGQGFLSRNYDFSIGPLAELVNAPLPPDLLATLPPVMGEPYIMEWHPSDGGFASLAIHATDLLSGTFDGINTKGLVVAILADHDAINSLGPDIERHPQRQRAIGLHELEVMRFLLDTCATADQAITALLNIKQYYSFVPCHYIVADRTGNSFVYENSTGRNIQHVFPGNFRPQAVTNFQLCCHGTGESMSVEKLTLENNDFWRYRELSERIARGGPFTTEEIKANNNCVSIQEMLPLLRSDPAQREDAEDVRARTLWSCLYDQDALAVEFSFYLGDDIAPDGGRTQRRSDYIRFALQAG